MKVALVYDRVNKIGGAERVLEALHEIFPDAPLYTAVYNPKTAPWAEKFNVIPSFLNKFPFAKRSHEVYPWLTPLAFESFDFSEFEVVISVTSEAAKGIITKPKTLHICYCLTPTRYLWSGYEDYFKNEVFRFFTKPVVSYLRRWDKIAAQRPDVFVAISKNVQQRIKKYYGRDSEVIYPPVDIDKFPISNSQFPIGEYFLIVSRLVPYKKVNIAIQAFNKLGLPLKVVGTGREMGRLKRMAKKNIEFLGQLTDFQLLSYYQRCQAVVFPQEEDFGLVPLEAQACGKPVIAYRAGGALETVIERKTGEFFDKQTPENLEEIVKKFKPEKYKPEDCRQNALKFDIKIFKKKWKTYLKNISTS
ncbi:glycosyltransferase family 4 protein [Candidatus Shapirobacteria bacterium CG_4_9_14_0_2_um_filter_39_11]|uniref:Glycosyltransferase family 4 protein n=1 Tax=Candidatus Shapirobacteria bacterium CG_4_9_14_0_2_um_filter_39_11 TaxID=1974478 RepID=A0A2M8ES85_9BACT|nr:MAG: glycosyltransferase family 4 protein [Candidatus Shapirobacteria bacterium CG_4_9_14_0_2_um_filter_39_11]